MLCKSQKGVSPHGNPTSGELVVRGLVSARAAAGGSMGRPVLWWSRVLRLCASKQCGVFPKPTCCCHSKAARYYCQAGVVKGHAVFRRRSVHVVSAFPRTRTRRFTNRDRHPTRRSGWQHGRAPSARFPINRGPELIHDADSSCAAAWFPRAPLPSWLATLEMRVAERDEAKSCANVSRCDSSPLSLRRIHRGRVSFQQS